MISCSAPARIVVGTVADLVEALLALGMNADLIGEVSEFKTLYELFTETADNRTKLGERDGGHYDFGALPTLPDVRALLWHSPHGPAHDEIVVWFRIGLTDAQVNAMDDAGAEVGVWWNDDGGGADPDYPLDAEGDIEHLRNKARELGLSWEDGAAQPWEPQRDAIMAAARRGYLREVA